MALEVFLSYSHRDAKLRDELMTHLSLLERQGLVSGWHDRKILPGHEWDGEIHNHLNTAHIILFLVSSAFISSKYCYDIEMFRAMERHENNDSCVIPILLRQCDWQGAPFGKLQVLPTDAKPVIGGGWKNRDEAFTNVVHGIRSIVNELSSKDSYKPSMEKCKGERQSFFPKPQPIISTNGEASEADTFDRNSISIHVTEEALNFDESGVAVQVSSLAVELTINRDFETYTKEDQERLLRAIGELLNIKGNINIKKVRRGSVKITIELSPQEAERLLMAINSGLLERYDVIGVKFIMPGYGSLGPERLKTDELESVVLDRASEELPFPLHQAQQTWSDHEEQHILYQRLETLTPREREVLALVVTGMLNRQIAEALGTSEKTIKSHRAQVMQKMHAMSVDELVRMVDTVGIKLK